jgi:hypothetical protein
MPSTTANCISPWNANSNNMLRLERLDRSHISRRRSSPKYDDTVVESSKRTVQNRIVKEPRILCSSTVIRSIALFSVLCIFWVIHGFTPSKAVSPIPSLTTSDAERQTVRDQILISLQETQLESYSALPPWVKEYMQWHQQQMRSFLQEIPNPTQRNTFFRDHPQYKFLIARCISSLDTACGGLSDRLKALPTLLLLAHESKRILLLHWSKPMRIEEFLLPYGYLNWSIPMILYSSPSKQSAHKVEQVPLVPVQGLGTRMYTKLNTLVKALQKNSTIPILCTRLQDQHGGSDHYDAHPLVAEMMPPSSRSFRRVFRALFFTLFRPSPLVLDHLVRDTMALERQLTPRTNILRVESTTLWPTSFSNSKSATSPYVVAHLRAFYGSHNVLPSQIYQRAMNAVNCAALRLSPANHTMPILFLSDSSLALDHVTEQQARRQPDQGRMVMTLSHKTTSASAVGGGNGTDHVILHLDKSSPDANRSPTSYVSIFTDLFFMSNGQCITYGQGGYGRMGSLLQRDPFCFYNYFQNSQFISCARRTSTHTHDFESSTTAAVTNS